MRYERVSELKFKYQALGLTMADLSQLFNEDSNTICQRFNGFKKLTNEKRAEWNEILDRYEKAKVAA